MSSISASVVISTLNRRQPLERALNGLARLHYDNFEVVVVNGPSTDGTDELLNRCSDRIKLATCPIPNLSASRNFGIAQAAGEIVAFMDDDAVPEPEWLAQIVHGFDATVAATGGKVYDHAGPQLQYEFAVADRLGNATWTLAHPSPNQCFPKSFEYPYLQGTNIAFRRDVLVGIGGFDEAYAYYLDEVDVCLRIADAGYLIRQLDEAFVRHMYAPSHVRSQKVATNRFPILKSKFYFASRNGSECCSPDEIGADNDRFVENHRSDIIANIFAARLPKDCLRRFEMDVLRARKGADDDLRRPRKLLPAALPPAPAFRRFRTEAPAAPPR